MSECIGVWWATCRSLGRGRRGRWVTTCVVSHLVERFARPELVDMALPGVLFGHVRLCLGHTEPEGGSDVATCKTRAVRLGRSVARTEAALIHRHAA